MLKPTNGHLLVEVLEENSQVLYDKTDDQFQKGTLVDFDLWPDHLTTSTGYAVQGLEQYQKLFESLKGSVIYWGKYGDSGQVFEQDGKRIALIPYYRVIGYEQNGR